VIKITKKELRTPDQIWQASRSLFGWLQSSATWIIGGSVAVFVVIVGILFWIQVADKTEAKAQYRYGLAKAYYETWTLASEAHEKQNDAEKAKADLLAELEKLQKEYPRSRANGLADGIRGQLAGHDKKWDEAAQLFERFSDSLPGAERDLGRLPLAQAYENGGNHEKALAVYSKLADSKDDFFIGMGLLGKARVFRATSKPEEARKTYEKYLEKFGSSQEAPSVRGLLSQVSSSPR
jgi:tetratricopeptide (TPR) repeat protein